MDLKKQDLSPASLEQLNVPVPPLNGCAGHATDTVNGREITQEKDMEFRNNGELSRNLNTLNDEDKENGNSVIDSDASESTSSEFEIIEDSNRKEVENVLEKQNLEGNQTECDVSVSNKQEVNLEMSESLPKFEAIPKSTEDKYELTELSQSLPEIVGDNTNKVLKDSKDCIEKYESSTSETNKDLNIPLDESEDVSKVPDMPSEKNSENEADELQKKKSTKLQKMSENETSEAVPSAKSKSGIEPSSEELQIIPIPVFPTIQISEVNSCQENAVIDELGMSVNTSPPNILAVLEEEQNEHGEDHPVAEPHRRPIPIVAEEAEPDPVESRSTNNVHIWLIVLCSIMFLIPVIIVIILIWLKNARASQHLNNTLEISMEEEFVQFPFVQ